MPSRVGGSRGSQRSTRSSRSGSRRADAEPNSFSSASVIEPSESLWQQDPGADDDLDVDVAIGSQRSVSVISDRVYLRFDHERTSSDGPLERFGSSQRTHDTGSANILATVQEQSAEGEMRSYIWGTRVCLSEVDRAFKRFLREFQLSDSDNVEPCLPSGDMGYYMQMIIDILRSEDTTLQLNLQHVKAFDEVLYHQIVNYPNDIITYLDYSINDFVRTELQDTECSSEIQIKPFNADRTYGMKTLEPDDIHKLICVDGMVIRSTGVVPELQQAFFECSVCNNATTVAVNYGHIVEPSLCSNCTARSSFTLIANKSIFSDRQIIKLQEFPDEVPPGQAPASISVYLLDNLVDVVMPGDRVNVTGIYRCEPVREMANRRTLRSVLRTFIDAIHVLKLDKNRIKAENDISWLKPERIAQIQNLAARSDVYERLAHAIAPGIYGYDDVKQALLFLLFGGTRKDFSKVASGSSRAEVNILLCGDPGTAKSQMLQCIHRLLPRGQYVSGKGASAAGLTAHVTRDLETKHFVLQIGALALSDNGVCCIDEFDKMTEHIRSVLQEVMEQQTLSVAKAGIVCQLNARAAILAAANPIESQWNAQKTILENVQLPHTLLSRFDLIFLVVDPQDEVYDRKLANHLVSLYFKGEEEEEMELMDTSLLKDYLAYAKAVCHPIMNEAAARNMIEKYVKMRQGDRSGGHISAYPRQLESLIRLAEARAKIRLSDEVQEEDVEHAYALYREALKQAATDPATGKVDVNILALGTSSARRRAALEVRELIKAQLLSKNQDVWTPPRLLLTEIREQGGRVIRRELFEEVLNEMCKDDLVFRGRLGKLMINRRLVAREAQLADEME